MKTSLYPLGLLSLWLGCLPVLAAGVLPEPTVSEIGPHHRVMQRTFSETFPNGRVRTRTSSYTELAVGMNYLKDGSYQPSREEVELFQDGAVFRQAQLQAIFAPNIATPAAIDLQTPSGRFQSHVLGLSIFNSANGQSEMVAEIKDCIGELHPPNVIIYPDAFTDVLAAVRYVASRDRFEQDIILFDRISLPPGWNPVTCRLEIWTEIVTAPTPVKTTRQISNLTDESLDFGGGVQRIGSGRAFMLEDPQGNTWSAPMAKTWITMQPEGRTFLVEAIEWATVAQQLNILPAPVQGAALKPAGPARQLARNAAGQRIFPRRQQAAKAGGKIQMAVVDPPPIATNAAVTAPAPPNQQLAIASRQPPALVLDYSLVTALTNFVFKGDSTWFVSGNCTLSGTNILEGGAVIKSTNNATLYFDGPIDCRTGPYSPAIFTSWCDDTVGEAIAGSTGNPWTNYAASTAIYFNSGVTGQLSHVRISHADSAISFYMGYEHEMRHLQIVHCLYAFKPYYAAFQLRNGLLVNCDTIISSSVTSTGRLEHATFNFARQLNQSTNCTVFLTNSLLIAVTNAGPYAGANNASNIDPAVVFQTVGAGTAYLLDNTYRNLGTTNISPTLLSELRSRTTYPPVVLSANVTTDTALWPQAQRDVDLPDLGYHYDPLDFVAGGNMVLGATLTLSPGTAVGIKAADGSFGLAVGMGSKLLSTGSPTSLNWIARYNTVQEQSNTSWTGFGDTLLPASIAGTPVPEVRARFTAWSGMAANFNHINASLFNATTLALNDCQFYGGGIVSIFPPIYLTNCLLHRVTLFLDDGDGANSFPASFLNNTFIGSTLSLWHVANNAWLLTNNLFLTNVMDLYGGGPLSTDYNGYVTNAVCVPLSSSANNALTNTTPIFQTGALGRFYLPTTSLFPDRASATNATNAALFGFHHYTTLTNNTPESTNRLDIGFHYAATTNLSSLFTPLDRDGDGLPDYFEDWNGNGVYDAASGETDWKTYNSKLGIGTNGPGLITFTPLK